MKTGVWKRKTKLSVLWVSKSLGVFHFTKLVTRRKLLILCYHGFELEDESEFRPGLFIRRETFARRLELIRQHNLSVLPLGEAVSRLQDGSLPDNPVCLTIDDGFRSVLTCAAPLLKQYQFASTLYVTTYYVKKGTPVFRLVVQYMFWRTEAESLDVTDHKWGPAEVAELSDWKYKNNVMWQIIDYGENQCDEEARERISETLGHRLGMDYAAIKTSGIVTLLTPDEIKQLATEGVDIQLHTHRHRLPRDSESGVRREITDNVCFLERIVARPLTHFCYPSGVWHPRQLPWLADLGLKSATTCEPGRNDCQTPVLALKRILDHEQITDIEFEAEISGFLEIVRRLMRRRRPARAG